MVGPHGRGSHIRFGICHPVDVDSGAGAVLTGAQLPQAATGIKQRTRLCIVMLAATGAAAGKRTENRRQRQKKNEKRMLWHWNGIQIMNFLTDWFVGHTVYEDQKLFQKIV